LGEEGSKNGNALGDQVNDDRGDEIQLSIEGAELALS